MLCGLSACLPSVSQPASQSVSRQAGARTRESDVGRRAGVLTREKPVSPPRSRGGDVRSFDAAPTGLDRRGSRRSSSRQKMFEFIFGFLQFIFVLLSAGGTHVRSGRTD
eukprot:Selendium_serpulae@DN11234_c0_g1_i1.p2